MSRLQFQMQVRYEIQWSALGISSGHRWKGGGILDALSVALSGLCIADTIDSLLVEVPMLAYQRRIMPMFTRHGASWSCDAPERCFAQSAVKPPKAVVRD